MKIEITDCSAPFSVAIKTNAAADADTVAVDAGDQSRGLCLTYRYVILQLTKFDHLPLPLYSFSFFFSFSQVPC